LDADLLRILRIIIDIDLHYNGLSPDKAIEKMSKYLSTDVELIVPEVYRYVAYPAQAMSYKIGETVYKEIYNKIKKDNNLNIDSKEMYLEYINILNSLQPEGENVEEYEKKSREFWRKYNEYKCKYNCR
jgi:hypothetical protein